MSVLDAAPAMTRSSARRETARRFTSARLGVRLARRELRRRPWRAFLVLLLVFLPTVAMSATDTFLRSTERSPAEAITAAWGRADARAVLAGGATPSEEQVDQLRAGLPAGSRLLVEHRERDRVRLGDRRVYIDVSNLDLSDPTAEGRFGPVQGRLPRRPGETVLSTSAARALDAGIGDSFTPDRVGSRLTVVGTVTVREGSEDIIYTPGPIDQGRRDETRIGVDQPGRSAITSPVAGPDGWTLEPLEFFADSEGSKTVAVFWSYVGGGVGLVVLGTVITAAFAVGARRQLRSVGLLSSSGASPSTVRWFLVAQGAVAGAVGSIVGVIVGVLAVGLVPHDLLDEVAGRPVEVTARLADLVPIVVIGTLAASIAAWLPARSAARVPTLQALAGRRPLPKVPRRLPVLGAVSVGSGCALLAMAVAGSRDRGSSLWALVAVAGAVAVLLGAIATAPWVIAGLERVSTGLPRSWRLAGRSLARSRVRSSAVVGAVCAVSATLIAGATLFASMNEPSTNSPPFVADDQIAIDSYVSRQEPTGYVRTPQPVPASVMGRIDAIVPDGRPIRLAEAVPAGQPTGSWGNLSAGYVTERVEDRVPFDVAGDDTSTRTTYEHVTVGVATPELLDVLAVPGRLRTELARGQAIGVTEPPYDSRSIQIEPPRASNDPVDDLAPPDPKLTVPLAGWFDSPSPAGVLPGVLISPATAGGLGYVTRPGGTILVSLPSPVTDRQRDRLQLLSDDLSWEQQLRMGRAGLGGIGPMRELYVSTPPEPDLVSPTTVRAGILAGSLMLVLAVVAVGLALAAKDSEDERQVLAAVGAPPRTLRRTSALQAALLVLVAGLISTPAGLLPAAAIVAATADVDGRQPTFRPDLAMVLFVLVVCPALVGLLTWLGGRLRDLARPKRPAVFAFGGE